MNTTRLFGVIALLAFFPLHGAELTLERIFASPELSGPSLRQARLSPAGDRVTFLRGREDDRYLLDLWEYHLQDAETRRLVAADEVVADEGELSPEEQARRERARIAALRGIVEYRWSDDGRFLLFPLGGDIYALDLADRAAGVIQLTASDAFDTDPRIAPDGRHAAFIRDQNLWIVEIGAGAPARALTTDGGGVIKNGMAEFIAQEEMGRSTGYWWSPDGTRIAFLRVDESPIEPSRRYEVSGDDIRVVDQRYPYAGTANVRYRLGVVNVADGGEIDWIDPGSGSGAGPGSGSGTSLGDESDPGSESGAGIYIPRVAWLPDGSALTFQRQSRDQKTLELVLAEPQTGEQRVLVRDTSDTWINLHDDLHFLSNSPAFIWSSERDGFRHLYLYNLDGELIRRLTAGEFAVDGLEGVDESANDGGGLVYFTAAEPSPTEKQLFRQSLDTDSPEQVTAVTGPGGWHEITMDGRASVYLDHYSDFNQPPRLSLHHASGEHIDWLLENRVTPDHPYHPYLEDHRPAEFGTLTAADGQALHYRLILPSDFDENRRWPVFVHVYGGPTHRMVSDNWGRRHLIDQYLARQGYIVFSLDNRGIERQGVGFQAPAYRNLGSVEIEDQITGVEFLKSLDYVDPERIGIFGWSYGGYMTLMALMQHPDTFAAGVAVAPVTDWALYDTHYTERYLGMPRDAGGNPTEPYHQGNVLSWADRLADPLLLVHPMADDNVLFTHSTMLMERLQRESIPFELMTYPGEKHAIAGEGQRLHVYRTIERFLARQLKPGL